VPFTAIPNFLVDKELIRTPDFPLSKWLKMPERAVKSMRVNQPELLKEKIKNALSLKHLLLSRNEKIIKIRQNND